MQLTHRLIEVFRAVMGTGHLTRAAELLHTSQPTVSREIARLEQVLGMALFERVRGRLRPTARAVALLEEVERSYIGLERIEATALSLRDFAAGRLGLACLPALAHALVPQATRRFLALRPQASLSIVPLESPLLEQALSEQRHDLGLIEQDRAPPATVLEPLLQVDEVVVLPDGHALLERPRLSLADLAHQPFISFSPADPYRQQIDALFARHGVPRAMALDTRSAVSVCALVRQGLGLAIINPLTAMEWAGRGLHIRPLTVSIPFRVMLVRPTLRSSNPLSELYGRALQEAAAELQAQLARLAPAP
ncbi:LysR family transcriptional regulator [Sphaerotilus hippei]|uniref:LysR family transcriptional regulator n=1 Tax=Sphaerotilus hippei TaxID=744406 RepID=A0A318H6F1_9BURK|nr:LysR family transcriptional regulator [Sphaerotilus hippei]PXW97020.1 LysR family transcriptional regulator [Sphaerotilus hippei]